MHLSDGASPNYWDSAQLYSTCMFLRLYSISGSLVLVVVFFSRLQQVMIQSIIRQCVFWWITLSPWTRDTSSNSITSLGFIPVICAPVSLSQSTSSYRYLILVDDTFSGSVNSCASWALNSCSESSLSCRVSVLVLCCYMSYTSFHASPTPWLPLL